MDEIWKLMFGRHSFLSNQLYRACALDHFYFQSEITLNTFRAPNPNNYYSYQPSTQFLQSYTNQLAANLPIK